MSHRHVSPWPFRMASRLRGLQAILEDLVHPTEVVGKRVRYRADASKVLKVYLDPKERSTTEYKLETFGAVYRCASFSLPCVSLAG